MENAKSQAEAMLSESQLMEAVQQEADRVRQQVMVELDAHRKKAFEDSETMKAIAYEEARVTREGADRYAEAILNTLGKNLNEFQTVVRNGQLHLSQTRSEASKQVNSLVGGVIGGGQKVMPPQLNTNTNPMPPQRSGSMPPSGSGKTSYSKASQEYLKRKQEQQKHRKLEV